VPILAAFISGLVFAAGLALSGMTNPANVLAFLRVGGGAWDPRLAFVMGSALAVFALAYQWVKRRGRPLLTTTLHLPKQKNITAKLVIGSAIFGIGWGLSGYCPGPALVTLGALAGGRGGIVFVLAMLVGFVLAQLTPWLWAKRLAPTPR
jgi:uncharacterized membrane protein YedE/YeeE